MSSPNGKTKPSGLSRREALTLGGACLGLAAVGGCSTAGRTRSNGSVYWPQGAASPKPRGVGWPREAEPVTADRWRPRPHAEAPDADDLAWDHVASGFSQRRIELIHRSAWTKEPARPGRVNPMGGASRITVHHEGWTPVSFTGLEDTADRLELIRKAHVDQRGWGDIGYHFVVDRAGRVWQARDLRYQGAHVRDHNEHNVGIMLLGNFEKQSPSQAQLAALLDSLRHLMAALRVPVDRVYTHQELVPTACPGRNLQPRVVSLRHNGYLA